MHPLDEEKSDLHGAVTEISGALGPLTMALLRRKVFTNHEKWKKCQKVLLNFFLPEV